MSWFAENLRLLALHHPDIAGAVEAGPGVGAEIRLVPTPRGAPTAVLGGTLLHSRYDPAREAGQQVSREVQPETDGAIVLGFGLGYATQALRQRSPDIPILAVEADPRLFRLAMEARDLRALFSDPRLLLRVGGRPEAIVPLLQQVPMSRPAWLRLRPALERDPAWYHGAEEVIRSWFLRREINTNTLKRFGRLWVRNLAHNLGALSVSPGVQELQGLLESFPALVVAGGPSLDDLRPNLSELARRCVVIAVNTPLRACVQAGVTPDFTVVVDPQYWASRSLDWTDGARTSILVAEPSTHPRVLRGGHDAIYLCSSLFPLGEWLEGAAGAKGKLGAGGSVTTSAWDLARVLGASPIYLAGLDLGFPGMRTHCRGVYFHDSWLSASTRLAPLEAGSFRALHEIGLFAVGSAGGGATPTDRRMLLYKWWFENQAILRPEVRSFTLSPHGAAIEGVPLATVEDVLSLPPRRGEIADRLRRALEARRPAGGRPRVASAVGRLIEELAALAGLAAQGSSMSDELARALEQGATIDPLLKGLDRIDARILELSARSVAGFLVQDLVQGVAAAGARSGEPREVALRSARLYAGVEESARWQGGLLRAALASLKGGESPKGS